MKNFETDMNKSLIDLLQRVEKLTRPSLVEKFLNIGGTDKFYEICELYERIANLYKINKNEDELKYLRLACEYAKKDKDIFKECDICTKIFYFYLKRNDYDNAEKCLRYVVLKLQEEGRNDKALMLIIQFADFLLESNDDQKNIEAFNLYEEAYENKETNFNASVLKKMGNLAVKIKNYEKAILYYTDFIEHKTITTISYLRNDILVNCLLCYLCCNDCVSAEKLLSSYDVNNHYIETFCYQILKSFEICDSDSFVDAITTFKNYNTLDEVKLLMLFDIKISIKDAQNDIIC